MSENENTMASSWIDPNDAPELTEEWFEKADIHHNGVLISRGRPPGSGKKTAITVRFDRDLIEAFRARGKGWHTVMNDALREWLATHTNR